MATDVEVSPKETIMDLMKASPASCNRKSKGIRDFFSATPKTFTSHTNSTVDGPGKKLHFELVCETELKINQIKDGDIVQESYISSEHKEKKEDLNERGDQNGSKADFSGSLLETQMPKGGKKRSLSTKHKSKETKKSPANDENTEENKALKDDEVDAKPQEMDYGEFLKSLAQNGDNFAVDDNDEKEQSNVPLSSSDKLLEDINTPKNTAQSSTNIVTDSLAVKPELSRAKATPNKQANAFSVLMQARAKSKSSDDDNTQDKNKEAEEIDSAESGNISEIKDNDSDKPEECPAEKNPTPSVLNFFTKTTKSTKNNSDTKGSVVVEADIHSDPSKQKITPVKRKSNNLALKKSEEIAKSKVDDIDNEIIFLGSEVIELDELEVKKAEPKRKDSAAKSKSCEKLETSHLQSEDAKEKGSNPPDSVTSVSNEKRKSFLQDTTPLDQTAKTSQATLQFGQGGKLAMNSSVLAKPRQKLSKKEQEKNKDNDVDANKKSAKSQKNSEYSLESSRPVRNTRLRKRKKPEVMVSDSDDGNIDVSQNDPVCKAVEERTKTKCTNIRQRNVRKSSGTESGTASDKDFTTTSKNLKAKSASRSRAKELLMKAKQKKQDLCPRNPKQQKQKGKSPAANPKETKVTDKPASLEVSSPDLGSRRQSRRIAAHQQKVKEAEAEKEKYISVDTESDSSEASTPKRKNKLNRTRKRSSSSSPRKPAKKLAPIFNLKSKEATPPPPPEDPEVVRRRREFLLSGVPSELKRQAAAATTVIASDFAPFPEHSHVQQKIHGDTENLHVWSLKSPEKIKALLKNEPDFVEAESAAWDWKSLQWSPVILEETNGFKTLDPVTGSISGDVHDHLLKDLQQTNQAFPFKALSDKFKERLSAAKDECTTNSGSAGQKTDHDDDVDIVIVDESEEMAAALGDRDSQWPETLQPKCTTEIIGNKSCLRRLKYWLEEWKTVIQREAKLSARSSSAKDSDFDLSDSEEEDSQLCNTMLLVGPHGVGKTAAVYALAQQLSYKVFEVNASSSRQGRHILAQLQEATQSHQVAQKKDGVILNPPPPALAHCSEPTAEKPMVKTNKKKTGVPNAFANFFKKTETVTETKIASKNAGSKTDTTNKSKDCPNKNAKKDKTSDNGSSRKRKRETGDVEVVEDVTTPKRKRNEKKKTQSTAQEETKSGEESNLAGCLNLTSTSLILFDEVDLVFEEDTGFLQTVQHFITTTKIPIIMTTSDPGFQRQLSARVETLIFTSPPLMSVASYLQMVCLAMGIRTCSKDLNALARLCKGDVRHALLTLQFLVLSGGGRLKEQRPVRLKSEEKATTTLVKNDLKTQCTLAVNQRICGGDSDSDGDFVCLKPLRKKPRRILDEEDGSLAAVPGSMDVQTASQVDEADSGLLIASDKLPLVHTQLHESVLAVSDNLHDLFATGIKNEYNASLLLKLVEECLKLKVNKADFIETSLLHFLPLPRTTPPARWKPVIERTAKKTAKRKRIRSDIFDSEASDDDDIMKNSNIKKDDQKHAEEVVSSVESAMAVNVEDSSKTSADTLVAEITNGGDKTKVKDEESKAMDDDLSVRVQGTETNDSPAASGEQSSEQREQSTPSLRGSKPSTDHGLTSKLLSSFATYYESMSVADTITSKLDTKPLSLRNTYLLPGIDDRCSKDEGTCDHWREETTAEMEVHASRMLFHNITTCLVSWKEGNGLDHIPEICSLPVLSSSQSSNSIIEKTSSEISVPESYKSMATTVMDNLPPHTSSEAIMLDYLPTLRCISQSEHCRQIAKTKRRFHHHFDSIGLCLGQPTVTGLCAEFPSEQQDV